MMQAFSFYLYYASFFPKEKIQLHYKPIVISYIFTLLFCSSILMVGKSSKGR